MKSLEKLGVQELNNSEKKVINGGSWIGRGLGRLFGALVRYSGPTGATTIQTDMARYYAK